MNTEIVKPKITVIVPLYNREKTILNCLKSIQSQTFNDFEVLVVDGQSTDNSRKLISEFCKNDTRFKLIENNTSHVTPDNVCLGLNNAKGDFVTFVDSDDVVLDKFLEILFSLICKYECDISQVEFVSKTEPNHKEIVFKGRKYKKLKNNIFGTTKHHSRCLRLFNSNLIPNILKYYSQYHDIIWEDTIFTYSLFLGASSFVMSNDQLYQYNFSRNNDCPKRIYDNEYFMRFNKIHELNLQIFKDYKLNSWQAFNIPIVPIFEAFIISNNKDEFILTLKKDYFKYHCVKKFVWKKGTTMFNYFLFKKACTTKIRFIRKHLIKYILKRR